VLSRSTWLFRWSIRVLSRSIWLFRLSNLMALEVQYCSTGTPGCFPECVGVPLECPRVSPECPGVTLECPGVPWGNVRFRDGSTTCRHKNICTVVQYYEQGQNLFSTYTSASHIHIGMYSMAHRHLTNRPYQINFFLCPRGDSLTELRTTEPRTTKH
jgi:hypothetical protein